MAPTIESDDDIDRSTLTDAMVKAFVEVVDKANRERVARSAFIIVVLLLAPFDELRHYS